MEKGLLICNIDFKSYVSIEESFVIKIDVHNNEEIIIKKILNDNKDKILKKLNIKLEDLIEFDYNKFEEYIDIHYYLNDKEEWIHFNITIVEIL